MRKLKNRITAFILSAILLFVLLPVTSILTMASNGEYTVYAGTITTIVINGQTEYVTKFNLYDDSGNVAYTAYCANMDVYCYDGSTYVSVSADEYFNDGGATETKILAALTYIANTYPQITGDQYDQLAQTVIWRIIHGYDVASMSTDDGTLLDILNHIYDNIGGITNDYNNLMSSITMQGDKEPGKIGGGYTDYGPFNVDDGGNTLLAGAEYDLTFDQGSADAEFTDENGDIISQVKSGEEFYVRVLDGTWGNFNFTASLSGESHLTYASNFNLFMDKRDVEGDGSGPYQGLFQPLFQPLFSTQDNNYQFSCNGRFNIEKPTEPTTLEPTTPEPTCPITPESTTSEPTCPTTTEPTTPETTAIEPTCSTTPEPTTSEPTCSTEPPTQPSITTTPPPTSTTIPPMTTNLPPTTTMPPPPPTTTASPEKWSGYDTAWAGWETSGDFPTFTGNTKKSNTLISKNGVIRSGSSAWAMGIEFTPGVTYNKMVELVIGQYTSAGAVMVSDDGNGTATVRIAPFNAKLQDIKCGIYTLNNMPNGNGNLTPKGTSITTASNGVVTIIVPYTVSKTDQLYVFVQCEASVRIN
ncbi:MAG: hypothetical protein FWD71_03235 [Oscillospiraceae bacterium]|nr:hypothetical protein [Oscillospiraceae bacterium]